MSDERWPPTVRLRRREDFVRVQRQGRRLSTRHLLVRCQPRVDGGGSSEGRLGLTVSRKVGGAVVRNRVKRCLREAARRARPLPPGLDVVFIARRSAAGAASAELHRDVERALSRVREQEAR